MSRYTSHFVREEELGLVYQAVTDPRSPALIVTGPPGVGKTTLLLNLYGRCIENASLFPVYCSCPTEETLTCSLIRIEQTIAEKIRKNQAGILNGFLINRIERELRLVTWEKFQKSLLPMEEPYAYAISLLERTIDPDANLTYQIGLNEAKSEFSATLSHALRLLGNSLSLVLIVDSDYRLNPDLLEVLSSTKTIAAKNLKLITATDRDNTRLQSGEFKRFFLSPFSQDQIGNLVSEHWPERSCVFTQHLWRLFGGSPLLTDAFLQLSTHVSQSSLDDIPTEPSEQYDYLSVRLYSQTKGASKSVIQALSVLNEGCSLSSLASIIGITPEEIMEASHDEPLISVFPPSETHASTWLDLYHPLLRKPVASLMPSKLKAHLHQRVAHLYLQSIESQVSITPPGTAISIPSLFRDYDRPSFVDAVIRTLPLALLVGEVKRTKSYVSEAIDLCHKKDITQQSALLNGMSILCLEEGDLSGAAHFCFEALAAIRQKRQAGFLENTILSNLAYLLHLQGQLSEALRYALEGLSISQQLYLQHNFQGSLAASLSNIGLLHEKLGDLENSLKYYESALQVDRRTNNAPGIASDSRRIGAILEDFGQYDRAIEMHLQALEIDKALNDLDGVASDYGNLGVTYHLKGDHERTVSWLKRSLELFTKIGATDKAAQVQKLLTEITSDSNAEGG